MDAIQILVLVNQLMTTANNLYTMAESIKTGNIPSWDEITSKNGLTRDEIEKMIKGGAI